MTSKLKSGVVFGLAALVLSLVMLEHPGRTRGANSAVQRSSNVAVIPGFAPGRYPGTHGVRACPSARPN